MIKNLFKLVAMLSALSLAPHAVGCESAKWRGPVTDANSKVIAKSFEKIGNCLGKKNKPDCSFLIVGFMTPEPRGVFSVLASKWKTFNEDDKCAIEQHAKLFMASVKGREIELISSETEGAGIPSDAPAFPMLVRNLVKAGINEVEIVVTPRRNNKGRPGWGADGEVVIGKPILAD